MSYALSQFLYKKTKNNIFYLHFMIFCLLCFKPNIIFIFMKKVSDALCEVIKNNPFLEFGLAHQLFNLTQMAKFVQNQIETRCQKPVKASAILTNLSRMQNQMRKTIRFHRRQFEVENITIQANLSTMTFYKRDETYVQMTKLYRLMRDRNGYIAIIEGMGENTIVFEHRLRDVVLQSMTEAPKYENEHISAVNLKFSKTYATTPGFMYFVLQQMALQNINIVDIASTFSELTIYVEKKDFRIAFETLQNAFS